MHQFILMSQVSWTMRKLHDQAGHYSANPEIHAKTSSTTPCQASVSNLRRAGICYVGEHQALLVSSVDSTVKLLKVS